MTHVEVASPDLREEHQFHLGHMLPERGRVMITLGDQDLPSVDSLPVVAGAGRLPTEVTEVVECVFPANYLIDTINQHLVHLRETTKAFATGWPVLPEHAAMIEVCVAGDEDFIHRRLPRTLGSGANFVGRRTGVSNKGTCWRS